MSEQATGTQGNTGFGKPDPITETNQNTAPVAPIVATAAPVQAPVPETAPLPEVNELEMLKQKANLMGIQYSNNIGAEALRAKIREKQEAPLPTAAPPVAMVDPKEAPQPTAVGPAPVVTTATPDAPVEPSAAPVRQPTLREALIRDNMKLVRLRITNMDPKKKDLPGEVLTVANEYLGTVRKFIPFGEVTENGYHVPYCLYKMLEKRRFLNIRTIRGRDGRDRTETNWVKEFALEILDPLTPKEIQDLATAQIAAGSVE